MVGTLLNVGAVLVGTALGAALGERLPARVRETVMQGVGLTVLLIGTSMALQTANVLIVLGAMALGGAVGALLGIEERLDELGRWAEKRFGRAGEDVDEKGGRFARGFVTASLLFCVGPMTVLGSIQDGLTGDYSTLAVKSMLDGIAAIALASTLGIGVILSAATVLVYQGTLTLGAGLARELLSEAMVREMSASGGLLILGIGLRILEIRAVPVANLLPAIVLAPLVVALLARLGLG